MTRGMVRTRVITVVADTERRAGHCMVCSLFPGFDTGSNLRRQAKSRPQEVPFTTTGERGSVAEPEDTREPGPEAQAIQTLERERLLQALADVPEPYRSAVVLVDLGELRYAEAAAVLSC